MKADRILEKHGINFELVEQDRPTVDCEDAADARGLETDQIVKSLIVESEDQLFHICIPGDRTLSERKFGDHGYLDRDSLKQKSSGTSNIRLVDPEKSRELTGQESGTVHPLASDLKHLIDERVFEQKEISFTTGSKTAGVLFTPEDFREALEAENIDYSVEDLVVSTDEDIQELEQAGADVESARFIAEKGYRTEFFELNDYGAETAVNVLQELDREEVDFSTEDAEEIIESAENDTHMQRLVKKFVETGDVPGTTDSFDLEEVVDAIIEDNPEAVEDYRSGKDSAINYLLGKVMERTEGRADGGETRELLIKRL